MSCVLNVMKTVRDSGLSVNACPAWFTPSSLSSDDKVRGQEQIGVITSTKYVIDVGSADDDPNACSFSATVLMDE